MPQNSTDRKKRFKSFLANIVDAILDGCADSHHVMGAMDVKALMEKYEQQCDKCRGCGVKCPKTLAGKGGN